MSEALDNALASTVEEGISHDRRAYRRELAQRIKQALDASAPPAPQASVVQEPVAVIGPSFQVLWTRQIPLEGLRVGDALYTHPQPAKQEPLTDRIEHLERVLVQAREALQEILNDTQHAEHFCGAECPVTDARAMVVTIDEALKG